jgi:hypothetical protein
MNVIQRVNGLQLNDDQIFDQKIESMFANLMILIEKSNRLLPNESDTAERELYGKGFFVNCFEKTGPQIAMNCNSRAYYSLCDAAIAQIFSCFPAFLIHLVPVAPAFSRLGS